MLQQCWSNKGVRKNCLCWKEVLGWDKIFCKTTNRYPCVWFVSSLHSWKSLYFCSFCMISMVYNPILFYRVVRMSMERISEEQAPIIRILRAHHTRINMKIEEMGSSNNISVFLLESQGRIEEEANFWNFSTPQGAQKNQSMIVFLMKVFPNQDFLTVLFLE